MQKCKKCSRAIRGRKAQASYCSIYCQETRPRTLRAKKLLLALPLASLMGCSAMSLQCGVDGDSSYVNLNATPKTLSQDARTMAELCSFSYQEQTNAT